jgi:hypothetical protein
LVRISNSGKARQKNTIPSVVVVRQRINHSVTERIKVQSSMTDKNNTDIFCFSSLIHSKKYYY